MNRRVLLLLLLQSLIVDTVSWCEPGCHGQIADDLLRRLPTGVTASDAELHGLIDALWQDAALLAALRDPGAPEHAAYWQAVRSQARHALQLFGHDTAQTGQVIARLRDTFDRYDFHSRLATWITVQLVILARECRQE
jgi:hypothetical protein